MFCKMFHHLEFLNFKKLFNARIGYFLKYFSAS